ncbi:hypothetical protein B0T10DRAFT_11795 [Thelonectria olida]|uniref:Uncharacterized protein n=1 Tax=Thelonectria olida TaxID=1576542 RepID=A0A9P8WI54_9HYPO|nr:hypothetical protein B0T10DRAFT_11795 [Thelonectria olida]
MPLRRTRAYNATPRRSIFGRRAAPRQHHHTVTTTTTTTRKPRRTMFGSRRPAHAGVVHHQKRKPTMKDKVSGALLKLKGSLTHRPAVKAAGTRRMHGTDGRGSHRRRRY